VISWNTWLHAARGKVVSVVIRTNELQVWFIGEHVVDIPLV
jgi:hypothetical protein